jgi:large-conductance mechanosensitive channel
MGKISKSLPMRGDVLDLAVAVIIGAAFGTIVELLVTHISLLGSYTASKLMDKFSGIPDRQGTAPA